MNWDPVKEIISLGKVKTESWSEVKVDKCSAGEFNTRPYLPHMTYMENVDKLLRMFHLVCSP